MEATVVRMRVTQGAANVGLSEGLTQTSAASWARTSFDTSVNRMLFSALADWWHEATDSIASPSEKTQHRAYRQVIQGGKAMVAFILEDLTTRGGDWYAALRAITKATPDPVLPEHYGKPQEMTKDWIIWLKENGYRV